VGVFALPLFEGLARDVNLLSGAWRGAVVEDNMTLQQADGLWSKGYMKISGRPVLASNPFYVGRITRAFVIGGGEGENIVKGAGS
jgi:hypothetical protein